MTTLLLLMLSAPGQAPATETGRMFAAWVHYIGAGTHLAPEPNVWAKPLDGFTVASEVVGDDDNPIALIVWVDEARLRGIKAAKVRLMAAHEVCHLLPHNRGDGQDGRESVGGDVQACTVQVMAILDRVAGEWPPEVPK